MPTGKDAPGAAHAAGGTSGRPTPRTHALGGAERLNTRRAYLGALARVDAWRGTNPLTDPVLAAYLGAIFEAGRAPATAALAVAAVRFRAKLSGQPAPPGQRPPACWAATAARPPTGAGARPPR